MTNSVRMKSMGDSLTNNFQNSSISIDGTIDTRNFSKSINRLLWWMHLVSIPSNTESRERRFTFRKVVVALICCMALPYYYYVHELFGVWQGTSGFMFFLLGNLSPPMTWFACQFQFQDGKFYEVILHMSRDAQTTEKYEIWLNNLIQFTIAASVVLNASYFVWLALYISYMTLTWKMFLLLLGCTFIMRLMAVFSATTCFFIQIKFCQKEVQRFVEEQTGECDIKAAASTLEALDENIRTTILRWNVLLVPLLVLPMLTFLVQIYAMIQDGSFIEKYWWFLFYEYHYFLIAWWVLYKVSHLTSRMQNMQRAIALRVAKGEAVYSGASDQEYHSFMLCFNSKRGVKLFGVLVDNSLVMRVGYVLGVITVSLVGHEFHV